jgi:uncharacterized protein (DUF1684 family)
MGESGTKTVRRSLWIGVAGLVVVGACNSGPPPPTSGGPSHADRVGQERVAKDEAFRLSPDSPIPEAERAGFTGLNYFPIDPAFNVPASLVTDRGSEPVIIELATSRNTVDRLARVGSITFRLGGVSHQLTAFAAAADGLNRLFVPFGDTTNRHETYGGGRYLNLTRTATGLYDLDFNMAYNPNCVYDVQWTCPLPPPENRLPVEIRAGERLPEGHE